MPFDWRAPDYAAVFRERAEALRRIRAASPADVAGLRAYYKDNPAQFVCDWGCTINPKNVERGLPAVVPFILYPKQREWIDWVVQHWRDQKPGITEKTRQMGFSWLSMALSCTMCIFHRGMIVGVGSRKQEYVDSIGDPKSLIQKGREFMRHLPVEFRAGWTPDCAPHMKMTFPETGALIAGEAGDNIGRGATTSLYFVDEAAFIERPHLVDAALSQTTNCRVDMSTPNGRGNPFAEKRFGGKIDVFTFRWQDDPTKDEAWYAKQVEELDPVTRAQELDVDYNASVEGVVIPSAWVQAAVGAHLKLHIEQTGARVASLDVADEGRDKNALCGSHGIVVERVEEWSGKGADIFDTVEKAFGLCDEHDYERVRYDSDGLGAGVRGDARIVNERRQAARQRLIRFEPFRGSDAVDRPESEDVKGRKNKDFFANRKAQAWWALRARFQATYRAVVEGADYRPDDLISFDPKCPNLAKLMTELSQPTYSINAVGKIVIDKAPDGTKSPNLADSVMIQFSSPANAGIRFTAAHLARV